MDNGVRYLNKHDLRQWRLLFAGEVMGYGFNKIGGLRQIVLKCRDFSSYWEQCKMYWGGAKTSTSTYKRAIFAGATQLHRGKSKVDSTGDLLRLLKAKPSSIPNLPGLLGGIVALLEAATGVYSSRSAKQYRGVNDFMSQAELRLKLTRMLAIHPEDDTSATFIESKAFSRYFRRVTRATKSTSSFMDIANLLLQKVYHQFCSIPCPPYISEYTKVESKVRVPTKITHTKDEKLSTATTEAQKAEKFLLGLVNMGNSAANTGQQDEVAPTEDLHHNGPQDTVAGVEAGYGTNGLNLDNVLKYREASDGDPVDRKTDVEVKKLGFLNSAIPAVTEAEDGKESKRETAKNEAIKNLLEAQRRLKALAGQAVEGLDGPAAKIANGENVRIIAGLLDKGIGASARASGVPFTVERELVSAELADRLHMFSMAPDLYMAPPPRCNVLFPEQVRSISFSRHWMRETTRLALHGRTERGRNKKTLYFSPNAAILHNHGKRDASGVAARKSSLDEMVEAMKRGVSFVMGHEKYSGPLPAIVGLGDNDVFQKLDKAQMKELIKEEKASGKIAGSFKDGEDVIKKMEQSMAGQARYSPQQHMQRAANYMFFAKRFATRSLSAHLRFSPQLVTGVPCVILDPSPQASRIYKLKFKDRDASSQEWPPKTDKRPTAADPQSVDEQPQGTHYVGVIDTIVHSFNASGGASTEIQLSNCREHRETVELFAPPSDESLTEQEGAIVAEAERKGGDQLPRSGGYASATKIYWSSKRSKADDEIWLSPTSKATSPGISDRGTNFDMDAAFTASSETNMATQTSWAAMITTAGSEDDPHPSGSGQTAQQAESSPYYQYGNSAVGRASNEAERGSRFSLQPLMHSDGKGQYVTVEDETGVQITYQVTKRVKITRYQHKVSVKFSFEQTTLPPWMASIFWPMRIGTSYYAQMFGCGSILDKNVLQASGYDEGSDNRSTVNVGYGPDDVSEDEAHRVEGGPAYYGIKFGGGDEDDVVMLPSSLGVMKHTTLEAVDDLAELYIGLKEVGANMDKFIDLYTERFYATIPDVLGTVNPSLTLMARDGRTPVFGPRTLGFHGNAYGDLKNLKGYNESFELVSMQPDSLVRHEGAKGYKGIDAREVDVDIDPRRLRYLRVMQYLRSINSRVLGG